MKGIHSIVFAVLIITGSIAGCLSSEEDDNSEYETQIADLEKQLDEKNSTIDSIQTQMSSYEATIDGLEDAISDAADYISNLEEGMIQEEAYRNSLILMLEDSNNSNAELQALLETSNNTILELQNSLAENQSLLSQASSIIADLVSGWGSTNVTLDSYLLEWGSMNSTLDAYLNGWNSTNSTIDSYLAGWDSTNSTVSDLLQQITELESSLVDCDTASTFLLEGECVSRNAIWGMIPFENGVNVSIGQSYRGGFTHHDDSMYSVDFFMSEGTPVVAYKAGKIMSIKEDSNINCIDEGITIENCTHGNYVVIDHGDFSFSSYLHLQQYSVDVEVGQSVGAGHQIGKIGNTGYSTEAHLHLEISNGFGYGDSIMILFEELRNISDGIPFAGLSVISQNTNTTLTSSIEYSSCPHDLFYFRGVVLTSDIPCSVAELDQAYLLTGKVLMENHMLSIGIYESTSQSWNYTLIQTNSTGHFSTTIHWYSNDHANYSYIMLSIVNSSGQYYDGWWTSVEIGII
jgi:murein DD-endopeptidase MepM/ murein hydrolase activator NlpD